MIFILVIQFSKPLKLLSYFRRGQGGKTSLYQYIFDKEGELKAPSFLLKGRFGGFAILDLS